MVDLGPQSAVRAGPTPRGRERLQIRFPLIDDTMTQKTTLNRIGEHYHSA